MAEVPLGPFEGAPITVYSAKGKNVRLHVSRACSQLRTSDVRTAQVSLESAVIGRLCSRCTEWGSWARPTTALGMFLRALGGVGLLYQMQSYTEPDDDDPVYLHLSSAPAGHRPIACAGTSGTFLAAGRGRIGTIGATDEALERSEDEVNDLLSDD